MASLIQVFLAGVLLVGFVAAAPVADRYFYSSGGYKGEEPGDYPIDDYSHHVPTYGEPEYPSFDDGGLVVDYVETAYETNAGKLPFSHDDDQGHSSTFDGLKHASPHHELAAEHEVPLSAHEDAVTENHEAEDSQHEDTEFSSVTEAPSHSFLPSFPEPEPEIPSTHDTAHEEEEEEDHGSFSRH
ncbi:uncharacterized protein LOC123502155 isoform X5 [Portunus trituberculatus]|uniref:uncharacterized protein LOC123502155 isoform X4 n=1 Tax=Portunus trituberculatus TaxID=210409 RepID=UPI001E1D206C|nr:uncharacterized protein LOC123502155 isoform X4 [Portunus trituberculatus]XP_045107319.1 uncharacterized protein LOC123502155 isoform X5 [Portunus trituberculatus]